MSIETLIAEMMEVKLENQTLEVSDVLRVFSIQAAKDLTEELLKLRMSIGR